VAALTPVRAAGGVVWRPAAGGPSVCLVHRPRHDDWSLPKGKLTAGEPTLVAAVREVLEETAVRAAPQVRLPSVSYWVGEGLPKTVDYWSMRELSAAEFTPNDEVDELRWLPVTEAARLLTYAHDGDVLRAFHALPSVSATVTLIRHAEAGDRRAWRGPDSARPLEPEGERQGAALANLLALFAPERLVSASPRRCLQTLAQLADRLDLPIEVDTAFDETPATPDGATAAAHLVARARSAPSTVVCGQGGSIAPAVAHLLGDEQNVSRYHTPKAAGWLLAFAGAAVAGSDRLPLLG
jgi:8-oxo-dGTP diphosphatase